MTIQKVASNTDLDNTGSSPEVVICRASYPALVSSRSYFRPFTLSDIPNLTALASEHSVRFTSIGIPPPLSREFARMWSGGGGFESPNAYHWAVSRSTDAQLMGYVGLSHIDRERRQAELRVWVGSEKEHWSYAAEWSTTLLQFALVRLNLGRIYAVQLARHPIAGQVLASIGMQRDGVVRKRIHREGPFEEFVCWQVLKEKWRY